MKLLIDGRPVRDPISGSAVFVINLFKNLYENNNRTIIFLQSHKRTNGNISSFSDKNSIITNGNRYIENLKFEINQKTMFSKYDFDITHETYFARLPFRSKRRVATIHDVIPLDFPNWFTWRNRFFAKRNFFRQVSNSDLVVFSSLFTKERALCHSKINAQVAVVPLAVSDSIHSHTATYLCRSQKIRRINNIEVFSGEYFLVVGNIEPRKNLEFIANGVKKFNDKYGEKFKLVIAGKSIYSSSIIVKTITEVLGDSIIVLGFVSEEDKIWLYQNTLCNIYASLYEGFGIPPIESIVVGAPTIISKNSSMIENIPSPVMSFESSCYDSFLLALSQNILKGSGELLGNNYRAFLKKYNWSRVASDYLSLYKKIL